MSATSTVASLTRLQQKALQADQLISLLKTQISSLHQSAVAKACLAQHEKLVGENVALRREVALLKKSLQAVEIQNGVQQVSLPDKTAVRSEVSTTGQQQQQVKSTNGQNKETLATENVKRAAKSDKKVVAQLVEGSADLNVAAKVSPAGPLSPNKTTSPAVTGSPAASPSPAKTKADPTPATGSKATADATAAAGATSGAGATAGATVGSAASAAAGADGVDVSRLDMRIGFIESAKRHPDADSLYVEEVNVGEAKCRTIVSGLVKHIPIEQMQKRYAIFLLNLKPARMRGITSEGMIMCASTPDKVEIIQPPAGVVPGERVVCNEYPGTADEMLNPKRKVWEQVQPDLRINGEGFASYKGALWRVGDKGTCKAPTMVNSPIK